MPFPFCTGRDPEERGRAVHESGADYARAADYRDLRLRHVHGRTTIARNARICHGAGRREDFTRILEEHPEHARTILGARAEAFLAALESR